MNELPPGIQVRRPTLREAAWLLWRRVTFRPVTEPVCPGCAYPVRGLDRPACPECGVNFAREGVPYPDVRWPVRGAIVLAALVIWTIVFLLVMGPVNRLVLDHLWPHKYRARETVQLSPGPNAYRLHLGVEASGTRMGGSSNSAYAAGLEIKRIHLTVLAFDYQKQIVPLMEMSAVWASPSALDEDEASSVEPFTAEGLRELFRELQEQNPRFRPGASDLDAELAELVSKVSNVEQFGDFQPLQSAAQWQRFIYLGWGPNFVSHTPRYWTFYEILWWVAWGLGCIALALAVHRLTRPLARKGTPAIHSPS